MHMVQISFGYSCIVQIQIFEYGLGDILVEQVTIDCMPFGQEASISRRIARSHQPLGMRMVVFLSMPQYPPHGGSPSMAAEPTTRLCRHRARWTQALQRSDNRTIVGKGFSKMELHTLCAHQASLTSRYHAICPSFMLAFTLAS